MVIVIIVLTPVGFGYLTIQLIEVAPSNSQEPGPQQYIITKWPDPFPILIGLPDYPRGCYYIYMGIGEEWGGDAQWDNER